MNNQQYNYGNNQPMQQQYQQQMQQQYQQPMQPPVQQPMQPPVQSPKKKKTALIVVILLLLIAAVVIAWFWYKGFFIKGGKESPEDVARAYVTAIKNEDVSAVRELLPSSVTNGDAFMSEVSSSIQNNRMYNFQIIENSIVYNGVSSADKKSSRVRDAKQVTVDFDFTMEVDGLSYAGHEKVAVVCMKLGTKWYLNTAYDLDLDYEPVSYTNDTTESLQNNATEDATNNIIGNLTESTTESTIDDSFYSSDTKQVGNEDLGYCEVASDYVEQDIEDIITAEGFTMKSWGNSTSNVILMKCLNNAGVNLREFGDAFTEGLFGQSVTGIDNLGIPNAINYGVIEDSINYDVYVMEGNDDLYHIAVFVYDDSDTVARNAYSTFYLPCGIKEIN